MLVLLQELQHYSSVLLLDFLFAYEVISKKASKTFILVTTISVSISILICLLLNEKPLFHVTIKEWHWKAFLFYSFRYYFWNECCLSNKKTVLFIKDKFTLFKKSRTKIIISGIDKYWFIHSTSIIW